MPEYRVNFMSTSMPWLDELLAGGIAAGFPHQFCWYDDEPTTRDLHAAVRIRLATTLLSDYNFQYRTDRNTTADVIESWNAGPLLYDGNRFPVDAIRTNGRRNTLVTFRVFHREEDATLDKAEKFSYYRRFKIEKGLIRVVKSMTDANQGNIVTIPEHPTR